MNSLGSYSTAHSSNCQGKRCFKILPLAGASWKSSAFSEDSSTSAYLVLAFRLCSSRTMTG